jgi:glucose-6-phosphatase
MDVVHGEGVRLILYLQNAFSGLTNEMLFLSRVGDPRNSFLIYFPVAYHLDRAVGSMVLWVAVLSEWLNLILKWYVKKLYR